MALLSSAFYNYHPNHNNYWFDNSENESLVHFYNEFPTFGCWVTALMQKNAIAESGFDLNMHLSKRLEYYLVSPELVKKMEDRIYFISETAALDDDLQKFARISGMRYVPKRINYSRRPAINELTEAQQSYLKSRFSNDFALYKECCRIRRKLIENIKV